MTGGRSGLAELGALTRGVHLWLGLALLAPLALLGATGSALVWEDFADKMTHPGRYSVSQGIEAPDAYLDAARQAFAGRAAPALLRMPKAPGDPVTVTGSGRQALTAWIDPGTARVLEVAEPRRQLRGWLRSLHDDLLLGRAGRTLVGGFGWVLLAVSATGLMVRRRPAAHVYGKAHRVLGLAAAAPLAILAFSGAWVAPLKPAAAPSAPLVQPRLSADQAVIAALAAEDEAPEVSAVILPTTRAQVWEVRFADDGGAADVRVDDASGRAVRLADRRADGGDPFGRFLRGAHDGTDYGPLWQGIIALAGLAPIGLGITGLIAWRRRPKTQAAML